MYAHKLLPALAALTSLASAYDVFAHYMVQGLDASTDHASQDITRAQKLGISAFALNVGNPTKDWSTGAIKQLFDAAADTDFKLFFSMDMAQTGDAGSYKSLIQKYYDHSAYFRAGPNNAPFLSTFQSATIGPGSWSSFLGDLGKEMYFVPMFDETEGYYTDIDSWMSAWDGVVDGMFSWEQAWPGQSGSQANVSSTKDEYVMSAGAAKGKSYMMALSSLQYKHWSGSHWFRSGGVNLPERMTQILSLEDRPEFVQVLTWNDAGESHYVGHLWSEGLDDEILAYASQDNYPHTGWQPLIQSFATAYKSGADATGMRPPKGSDVTGAMWYRAVKKDTDCGDKPAGAGAAVDAVNWAVVVGEGVSGYKTQVWSGGVMIRSTNLDTGLNYFSAPGINDGVQYVEVIDGSNNIIISGQGGREVGSHNDGFCNYNFQVAELK